MDKKTREIVGVYVGDRSEQGARGLWNSLPPVYRQCAVCYTDFWVDYENVIPKKRHQAVGKARGKTNHIERFNNTMRQCHQLLLSAVHSVRLRKSCVVAIGRTN